MEYEIKILGARSKLLELYRKFMDAAPSVRDRNYGFSTYYLDTPEKEIYRAGYSFRYRTGNTEGNYKPVTEIKALAGAKEGVSARLELKEFGDDPMKNYFNHLANPDCPKIFSKISPSALDIAFATAVRRMERKSILQLPTGTFKCEASLDDIAVLKNEGRNGYGIFDVVLYPHAHEDELELELKPLHSAHKITDRDLAHFMAWAAGNVINDDAGHVKITTLSKAVRAHESIYGRDI